MGNRYNGYNRGGNPNGGYRGGPAPVGYRGGYGPFYEAVVELSARGVFDAGEVSAAPGKAKPVTTATTKGGRDEYTIPFVDSEYAVCRYKREGNKITIACDEMDRLYVEEFHVWDTGTIFPDTGVCRMVIQHGGKLAHIFTGNTRIERAERVRIGRYPNNVDHTAAPARREFRRGGDNDGTPGRTVCATPTESGTETKGTGVVGNRRIYRRT